MDPEETAARRRLFGNRLAELREASTMSQQELAFASRLSLQTIMDLEANNTEPHLSTLQRLAHGLGVELIELITPR